MIPKMLFLSIYDEKERSYCGKPVSEQWRHRALVDAWPSWIDARRQYILLVTIIIKLAEHWSQDGCVWCTGDHWSSLGEADVRRWGRHTLRPQPGRNR